MKTKCIIILYIILTSCATTQKSIIEEDVIFITRKYVGNYIESRHSNPIHFGDPHIIWIKTTFENTYGKISAYSRKCEFKQGEKLFIRRTYLSPGGISGFWIYQLESDDSKTFYRISEFQYGNKVLVQTWF